MAQLPSVISRAPVAPASEAAGAIPRLALIVLQAAVFLVAAEARVIAPMLPAMAADLHTTIVAAGGLITAYALPYGAFQLIYGPLADRFSRQRVLAIALGLFALGTLSSAAAPSIGALLALRIFSGAAAAGVVPVALAAIGDAVPYAQRQAALGRIVSVAALGGVVSAALGGAVAELVSWRVLFLALGAPALLVSALLLRMPARAPRRPATRPAGMLAPYRALATRAGWSAGALFGVVFVEGFAAMSTIGYLGALLVTRDRLSYGLVGALLTLNGVGTMLAARGVGRLVARMGERRMVLAGGALMALAYVLAALQPTLIWFPLAMLGGGVGFAIAHSTLQTRATELAPEQRGTAIALFAFALSLGGGVGTAVAGQAIERLGYFATLLGTAATLALFAAVAGLLLRARPPAARPAATPSGVAAGAAHAGDGR